MIYNWRKASIGTSLVMAAIALGGYAYTRATAPPTHHLANGVDVTVAEVPQDDMARLFDVHVWKIDVMMPDARQMCELTLDKCGHQTILSGLGGGGFQPSGLGNRHCHITLDMAPLGGNLGRSQEIKYYLEADGAATSGVFANPFRSLEGLADGVSVSERDNRIYLMGGGKQASSPAGWNDVDIALVIEPGGVVPH